MKTKKPLLVFLITACAAMATPMVHAATYYWDIDDTTAGAGGVSPSGFWETDGLTWSADALGASVVAGVTTTSSDDLVFSSGNTGLGTFNVTLGDAQIAKSLTFEEGNVIVRGAGGVISLEGTGGNTRVTNGAIATIGNNTNLVLSGTLGLTKLGVGTLTLTNNAVNTVTGDLAVKGGTLALNYTNLATPTDLIDATNALILGGGSVSLTGKATGTTNQTFNGVTVAAGGGTILGSKNGGTALNINLGAITATATGGSLLLGGTSGSLPVITTSSTNDATGILGGRTIYFNGTANTGYDFAAETAGTVGPYASYTAFVATGSDPATNYRLQTSAITGVTTQSVNTLKIIGVNLTQTTGNTLTIEGGGLMNASATGTIIAGGNLTAGNGSGSYDLNILVGGTGGGQMTLTSNVVDNDVNSVSLVKTGPGTLILNSAKGYTGSTYVNQGILDFATFTPAGTGRNIHVVPGALVKFASPSTALLNRIAQTDEEIGIITASNSSAAIDFSPTGADLPNAFLAGGWFSNGAKNDNFTGTITPANNTYRIGFPGAAGTFGVSTALDGASNNLIVGGNNVCLTSANTFGGETRIRTGAALLLANTLALQNSALNVGTGSDTITGLFSLSRLQTNLANDKLVTSATLGGLIGSRNLATAYGGAYGNNAGSLSAIGVRSFTLNPESGESYIYTGSIANFARDTTLTKTGAGTQELGGSNGFSGTTTISDGVLKISNANALGRSGSAGASSGATIVASSGTLDLNGAFGVIEPIILNGTGFGGTGALVNNSESPAAIFDRIASLQITSGGTYTGIAPTATINGTGTGATATVQLGLSNASLTISGGSGWVVGDLFTTSGGAGTGAVFEVTSIGTGGSITGINIVNSGAGYTTVPTAITKLTRTGTANGTLSISYNLTNNVVAGLTLTNPGADYDNTTTVSFSDGDAVAVPQYSSVILAADSSIGGTGDIELEAPIKETGGSYGLTKIGPAALKLSGNNTYTGNTTVSDGTLELLDDAQLKFVLGASSGVNNALTGTGTVILDGDFVIDTTAADALSSGTWTLENVSTLTGSYGASFSVVDFTDAGDNLWIKTLPGKTYTFDETTGILTLSSGGDTTPPTLTSITDNVSGGPVNIGDTVTYTVTFDEDMDAASVTSADFANNGTAVANIGAVTETITPGVFTVPVTVTSPGTLVLRINALAILEDVAGNDLDTDPAILDDTTITVRNAYQTWALTNAISSAPGADKDGDGVNNAVEFLLGGDVGTNDLSKLPEVTMTATDMIVTFERKRSTIDGITGLEIEVGTTLTGWPTSFTVGTTTANSDAGVTVAENSPSGFDTITLTVPKGTDPKKFARLNVTVTE